MFLSHDCNNKYSLTDWLIWQLTKRTEEFLAFFLHCWELTCLISKKSETINNSAVEHKEWIRESLHLGQRGERRRGRRTEGREGKERRGRFCPFLRSWRRVEARIKEGRRNIRGRDRKEKEGRVTELIELGVDSRRTRDGTDQPGFEEGGPTVD